LSRRLRSIGRKLSLVDIESSGGGSVKATKRSRRWSYIAACIKAEEIPADDSRERVRQTEPGSVVGSESRWQTVVQLTDWAGYTLDNVSPCRHEGVFHKSG